ncbi:hypothetical protein DICVIV_08024 [Dictyocaulus viviparus]|uniref:Uncharacterized protein n=1 Tax=Dictyocaulus viviparus TaxID=29172 RepID=A0A0D8XU88_DICVI|nr:hypothetical protein DICVIV_08024 [Dictyocaulus viviparus]
MAKHLTSGVVIKRMNNVLDNDTIDIDLLYAWADFYTVTTDISSFLPILACALRLPIYAINDKQIRTEVSKLVLSTNFGDSPLLIS